MRILIVEDDPVIGKSLHRGMTESGHPSILVPDGRQGLEHARSQQFDAIILDLLLPELNGSEVLKQIRASGVATPVILLTALGSVEERVQGLQLGADDYLVKPFALVELLARLEAVCRRSGARPTAVLRVGDLCLELATRRVTRDDLEIDLTPTEFSLLEMLMRYAGQVVSRKMLCEHLWQADWEGATNIIEVHINRLRGKLLKGFTEPLIHTVRGRGYALRTRANDRAIPPV